MSRKRKSDVGGSSQPDPKVEVRGGNVSRAEQKLEKLQAQCARFNAECPVGTEVLVKTDSKGNLITKTRSEAYVLSGHTPVIFVEGISGCYLLDRVSKVLARFERADGKLIHHPPTTPSTRTTHPNPADQLDSNTKE
jgi:hypothetical protein